MTVPQKSQSNWPDLQEAWERKIPCPNTWQMQEIACPNTLIMANVAGQKRQPVCRPVFNLAVCRALLAQTCWPQISSQISYFWKESQSVVLHIHICIYMDIESDSTQIFWAPIMFAHIFGSFNFFWKNVHKPWWALRNYTLASMLWHQAGDIYLSLKPQ